jgi:DNA-binding response OmpR family regulator
MTARPRTLLVGNELILLRARKMILDIQFNVSISARLAEAAAQIEGDTFDLIVICDDADNWKQIVEFASSKNPTVKIIAVTMREDEQLPWVDATVCFLHGPYALLKLCARLFGLASTVRAHGFSMGGTGQPGRQQ